MPRRFALVAVLLLTATAEAVIVRGHVTTPLGVPLAAAHVQLVRLDAGARSVADAISGLDGSFEIRTDLAGRFLLLTAPSILSVGLAPQIGNSFYAGRIDLITLDIHLNPSAIVPQLTALPTLIDTPLRELATPPTKIAADQLLTRATTLSELRPTPGAFLVQYGQLGSPAALYVRGAPVAHTLIDNVSAESLGGPFDLGSFGTTGLASVSSTSAIELRPVAAPFLDAQSGTLAFHTPTAADAHPTLTYTGDAGNLSTTRNEVSVTLVHTRSDLLAAFSRLNTDNDLPAERLHIITSAASLGYYLSANTSLRITLRDDTSSIPLPSPFAFYNVQVSGKDNSQNLYSSNNFETRTAGNWHNLFRYGLTRKRSQVYDFSTALTGLPVTVVGANGYSVSGIAAFPATPAREDFVTNRDEFTYQTDRPITHFVTGLLTARYQDERAADILPSGRQSLDRHHISVAGALQGDLHHRVFYQTSGFIDSSPLLGLHGAPALGLTYVPVRPGPRRFHGTSVHGTAAAGLREPTLAEESAFSANPLIPRSRTFDISVDQDIAPHKVFLHATYFHNQFAHQGEPLALNPLVLSNALAFRAQGFEATLRYQPTPRFSVEGGYTYLAALVERSATTPSYNPIIPSLPIGALTALVGARPFHRPPDTGFASAHYTGRLLMASISSSFAGASDDSTKLYLNKNLLLPNRNLSPGFASVDAIVSLSVTRHLALFVDLTNLTDNRHVAPVGYLSTPFAARAGVRLRIGHE